MQHITLTKQLGGIAAGLTSGILTPFAISNALNGALPVYSLLGPVILGTSAVLGSDEFYSEVRDSHQGTAIVMSTLEGAFALTYALSPSFNQSVANGLVGLGLTAPSITSMLLGTGAIIAANTFIIPYLADKLYEYTHPEIVEVKNDKTNIVYIYPTKNIETTVPAQVIGNDIELSGKSETIYTTLDVAEIYA